eukprot:6712541-Prymnesium_polylepis.2
MWRAEGTCSGLAAPERTEEERIWLSIKPCGRQRQTSRRRVAAPAVTRGRGVRADAVLTGHKSCDACGRGCESASVGIRVIKGGTVLTKK